MAVMFELRVLMIAVTVKANDEASEYLDIQVSV